MKHLIDINSFLAPPALSTLQIINCVIKENDPDKYWKFIAELHKRGTELEFNQGKALCQSSDPIKREIGADILGQLGCAKATFLNESVDILINLLKDDADDVVSSAAYSLGHRNHPKAIKTLVELIYHDNAEVRQSVTFGLSQHENPLAINALIELSKDKDDDVRNWATFNLGTQIETNSEAICNALLARTKEENIEIRGEALVGLANRKYHKILSLLKKELSQDSLGILALEAAETVASHELLPLLKRWKVMLGVIDDSHFEDQLNAAINACK